MTEQELRTLVREALARHLGGRAPDAAPQPGPMPQAHPSHGLLRVGDGAAGDGRCVIEPAVACTHCGYCQSYGH